MQQHPAPVDGEREIKRRSVGVYAVLSLCLYKPAEVEYTRSVSRGLLEKEEEGVLVVLRSAASAFVSM